MATRIGQLAQDLAATNGWWRSEQWAATDPDLRAAAEQGIDYDPRVLHGLSEGGLYLLRGPRRVGKTVAVKRAAERLLDAGLPPTCVVHAAVDGWQAKDLRTLVQNAALPPVPAGQVRWWFIDEVTAAGDGWDEQVKWLRDNLPEFRDACVVLTGSDAEKLSEAAGTLAGRRGKVADADRTLLPMGFRTFVGLWHELPDLHLPLHQMRSRDAAAAYQQLLPWLNDLVRTWDVYLQYGGFPVAAAAAKAGQPVPAWFCNDLSDVIVRDVFQDSRQGTATVAAMLERVWQSMATPLNKSSVADDVGVTPPTVTHHLQSLHNAYLAWTSPRRQDDRWLGHDRAQAKVYAVDPLIARLAHLRNPQRSDIDPTVLTEMMIGMALRRAQLTAGRMWADDPTMFYVRTPARKEIDFVSEAFAGTAVEGKYTEGGNWRREAATVNASEWDGILVTRNVLDVSEPDGAWAVPAGVLAYLLDE
jgi:predicted AAA+ superfamily ATPase